MPTGTIVSAEHTGLPPIDIGCVNIDRPNGSGHTILLPYRFTDSVIPYTPTGPNPTLADNEFYAIRIESLPPDNTGGYLVLNNITLVVGNIVLFSLMTNTTEGFIYKTPNQGPLAIDFAFTYSVSNVASPTEFISTSPATGECAVTGEGDISTAALANQPPDVLGNTTLGTLNRTPLLYTEAQFTSGTTPAYNDPEGDPALQIKVLTLPVDGQLLLNAVPVSLNQVIIMTDIGSSLFSYVPPNQDALDVDTWNFTVEDTGSGQFSAEVGIQTINSAAIVPLFDLVNLGFDAGPNTSCLIGLTGATPIYIPAGDAFSTTAVIWLNSDGTGVPPAGYYSDGVVQRLWDGVSSLGIAVACLPIVPIDLGFDATSGVIACGNFITVPVTYYSKIGGLLATDSLWSVLDPLTSAPSGWYSDGVNAREWDNVGNFVGLPVACP
jgi:hypothetical protein